ncbi:hypothetical protein R0381_000182 [Jeongeupia wiesaeckerbachi]|uniref:hypothetical protein n=1 Tax=Jeongeupia wiesaeckerbachi TaxID=3051218 RepID=UPI003D807FE8
MRTHIALLAAGLLLQACSSAPTLDTAERDKYNPETNARMRLYGNNGGSIRLYPGKDCNTATKADVVNGSGSHFESFKSMLGDHQIKSIGMPDSEHSKNLGYGETITEKLIPAGVPMTVVMHFGSPNGYCFPPPAAFTPQPGKDYEAFLHIENKRCYLKIDVIGTSGAAAPQPYDVCSKTLLNELNKPDPYTGPKI